MSLHSVAVNFANCASRKTVHVPLSMPNLMAVSSLSAHCTSGAASYRGSHAQGSILCHLVACINVAFNLSSSSWHHRLFLEWCGVMTGANRHSSPSVRIPLHSAIKIPWLRNDISYSANNPTQVAGPNVLSWVTTVLYTWCYFLILVWTFE